MDTNDIFALWRKHHRAPYHFDMDQDTWNRSMYYDTDSDGRKLFSVLEEAVTDSGYIQYGITAFGFDDHGALTPEVSHRVIRSISYENPQEGQHLLDLAMGSLGRNERIHAYFHYFGMSACGRHGKLHEQDDHIHQLLLSNGFMVEHENVYYARTLTKQDLLCDSVSIAWKPLTNGGCRDFAILLKGEEVGWGQVHFLPQRDIAYLRWICIAEHLRHQGIGTNGLQALFSDLYCRGIRRFDTDTARNNTIAQRFYEKTGFVNKGITRSYFTK